MTKIEITQELLKELFDYRDGYFYWKVKLGTKVRIGNQAGTFDKWRKRNTLRLYRKTHYSYRLIFLYHHGYLPIEIDHINNIETDDRIENLRAATPSQNKQNRRNHIDSFSKYKGVTLVKNKYWRAVIIFNGTKKYLGSFKSEVEAAKAFNKAALIYHGEFANLNQIEND